MSFNTIKVNSTDTNYIHSIFDISEYNSGAIYANLSAALAAVPQNKQQKGMTVKFIQQIPARYSVVKTENLETEPTGTLLSEAPAIDSGIYDESQLSTIFSALPSSTGAGNALTYYVAVTVDETTTYTSWVITKVLNSKNKYVQYRLMSATWSTTVSNWQGVDKEPTADSANLVESEGVYLKNKIQNCLIQQNTQKTYKLVNTGRYVSKTTGMLEPYQNAVYSDFIPVLPGQQIKLVLQADSSIGVCFYKEANESSFISGSGISVNYTYAGVTATVPENAYFVRASSRSTTGSKASRRVIIVSDIKSLQDIPPLQTNTIWEKYSDNSDADTDTRYAYKDIITRRNVYNCIKSIKLIGFDRTKKHTLYVLWGGGQTLDVRISEFDGTSWRVVFEYKDYNNTNKVVSFDYKDTYQLRNTRVIACIEFPFSIGSDTLNALNATPEYIFAKTCYELPDSDTKYTAGTGIRIDAANNNKISVYPDEIPVQSSVLNGESSMYDVPISEVNISGFISSSNGLPTSHQTYHCSDFKPVLPGQVYITTTTQYSSACIAFYDANKVYHNQFTQQQSTSGTQFTVPDGCYWMRISNGNTSAGTTRLKDPQYEGLIQLTKKVNNAGTPFATTFKLYPKTMLPCVSFQFDDNPRKDEEVVSLFQEYHKTCAFAFIASLGNMSAANRYIGYQQAGFQIMNHCIDGNNLNPPHYDYDSARDAIMTAKHRIESVGMVCNGFVCPSSSIAESFKPILEFAHAYAFTTGTGSATNLNGRNANRCDLHRKSIQSDSVASLKAFIDACIANDQLITFYGHASDLVDGGDETVFSIAKIRALIEYCIQKENNGELFFAGTDECVKYFFNL